MASSAPPAATPAPAAAPAVPPPPPGPRAVLVPLLVLPVAVAALLWCFAWPAARTAPNELPVGVAGPAEAAQPVAERLAARDGAFDVRTYPDAAAAREAIEDREVYGAFVAASGAPDQGPSEVLTASAGGPAVAELLTETAAGMAADPAAVGVTDVVPSPGGDPRGTVFNAATMPLALAGIATGIVVTVLRLPRARSFAAVAGAAALMGLAGAGIGHTWLDALGGNWLAVAAALWLIVLASGVLMAGMARRLGQPGIGVATALIMFMGNPWSGAGSAPEMLPDPIGFLGQLLPLGAGATLVRSVAFFDGAAIAFPLLVLSAWTAVGLAILWRTRAPGASRGES